MTIKDITKGTWIIDPTHSRVDFQVKHLMVSKVRGNFGVLFGEANVDGDNTTIKAEIDVSSISTNEENRDAHLRSPDFFDVEKFPKATFVATDFEAKGDDEGKLIGDLTIRDVTQSVVFDVEFGGIAVDPYGNTKAALEGKTKISRGAFGLTWNTALETGGVLVSDEVVITFEVQAVLQK